MDKAALVTTFLSPALEVHGEKLVKGLEERSLDVEAAFWLLEHDPPRWRLVIATPRAQDKGPLYVYKRIQEWLQHHAESAEVVTLEDTRVVDPDDEHVQALRAWVRQRGDLKRRRVANIYSEGVFIDALVYRL